MQENNNNEKHPTACILCSINCGITIEIDNQQFVKIKGDEHNLKSEGYICQKAARLNYYQNHSGRLTQPLSKNQDGRYTEISWEKAIKEVAEKLNAIRKTYGNHSIAFYGGGGQGNHLCQSYSSSFRKTIGIEYLYNALAQEKTGDFWVNGKLFGKQSCHISEDIENADYVLFIGTNPFQSHGFPQSRKVLNEIVKDPNRKMVVVDPRKTKTAEKADFHLQLKSGTDAFLLSAMIAIMINENLVDMDFINKHTIDFEKIKKSFSTVPIREYIEKSGLDYKLVKQISIDFSKSKKACVRVDLGIQQSIHSTLNSYLEKLLFIITGNFGKEGTNNIHTQLVPIVGHSNEPKNGGKTTKVTGMREISNFFPPNILPAEIDNEHPDRIRALIVDSSNPILTAADSKAYIKAFKKLDLLVVIDVANTETAKMADYVLPAQSQFEKWEASFFTLDFPINYFQLRKPLVKPIGNTLSEPEIYKRILIAMGLFPKKLSFLLFIAKIHSHFPSFALFPITLKLYLTLFPKLKKSILFVLYETIGKNLKEGAKNAAMIWGVSHLYAKKYRKAVLRTGLKGKGFKLGEALFKKIIDSKSGLEISKHKFDEVWGLIKTKDKKIHLYIPEMITALDDLKTEQLKDDYPFILAAGERRSYNANQIYRDPNWRKKDMEGALRIHSDDAIKIGVLNNDYALVKSDKHQIKVKIEYDNAMNLGFVSLPHGYGFDYLDAENPTMTKQNGPKINMLTSSENCDPITKTPYHKYVPVSIETIESI